MSFESVIQSALARFASNGRFLLLPGESIKEVVRRGRVPNAPGVYVYSGRDDLEHPLYIGKAGTIRADGSWKDQGLKVRLTMKQGGMFRSEFFRKLMAVSVVRYARSEY